MDVMPAMLHPGYMQAFNSGEIPHDVQTNSIEVVKDFLADLPQDTETKLRTLGLMDAVDNGQLTVDERAEQFADHCAWVLARLMRYIRPTRIAEAAPYLQKIVAHNEERKEDAKVQMLYLAVALTHIQGRDEDALKTFKDALKPVEGAPLSPETELWGRAVYSRLLRKLGKADDAVIQEEWIRSWTIGHPGAVPPSTVKRVVLDEDETAKDFILDHEDIRKAWGAVEAAPNAAA